VALVHQPVYLLTQYLTARALQREVARVLILAVTVNLALSVALAFAVGTWGVALSTLVTDVAALGYVVWRLAAPAAGVPVRALVGAVVRPVVPAAVVAVLVLVAVARLVDQDTILGLLPIGVLWALAGGAAIVRFGLEPDERRTLLRLVPGAAAPRPAAGSG
jgi:peptidoglycan biosynthesis protein MviN/MurJ (putative lipid II flippase)